MTTDIKIEFLVGIEQANKAIASLQGKVLKLEEANASLVQKSKEGHGVAMGQWREQESGVVRAMKHLTGMAAGYVTVSAAIGVVREGTDAWHDRLKAVAETNAKIRDQMLEALGDAGKVKMLGASKEFIDKTATASGMTREKIGNFLAGSLSGDPTADIAKHYAIASALAPAGEVLDRPGQQKSSAELAIHLGRYAAKKTPEQLANLAVSLRNQVGSAGVGQIAERANMNIIGTAIRSGATDTEGALAISALLYQGDKSSREAGRMLALLGVDKKTPNVAKRSERLTPDEETENKFYATEPSDRLRLLQEDPKVRAAILKDPKSLGYFEGENAILSPSRIAAKKQVFTGSQEGEGAISRQVRELEETDVTGDRAFRHETEFLKDQAEMRQERLAEAKRNLHLRNEKRKAETNVWGGIVLSAAETAGKYLNTDAQVLAFDESVKANYGAEARAAQEERKKQTELLRDVKDTLGGVQKSNAATAARASGREGGH